MPGEQLALYGLQTLGQIGMQGMQNQFSRRAQHEAFMKNLMMWDIQNRYNHPKAQMQRYREAGLNPNLIYGQGTAGNAEQVPKYMANEYRMSMPDVLGMIGQYQNIKVQQEQQKNISADTAGKTLDNLAKKLDKEIKILDHELKFNRATYESREVYNEIRKSNTSEYVYQQDRKKMYEKARQRILDQQIEQTETFLKYMDYSQVGGIAGDIMRVLAPFMQFIGQIRGQNLK